MNHWASGSRPGSNTRLVRPNHFPRSGAPDATSPERRHPPATESPLANLMTDALRDALKTDLALHNVVGGIRAELPAGELTFGSVYQMFPFDNRVVILELTGAQLRHVIAAQAHDHRRRAGFSGMRVFVSCHDDRLDVRMRLDDGRDIRDGDRVSVLVNDFLVLGGDGILTPVTPPGGFVFDKRKPLIRDVLVAWFRDHPGTLDPHDFATGNRPKWNLPETLPSTCALPASN